MYPANVLPIDYDPIPFSQGVWFVCKNRFKIYNFGRDVVAIL
jgi:hypothetical protein